MKRANGAFEPIGWDEAYREIGKRLGSIRKAAGPRSIALYAGDAVTRSSRDMTRTFAMALALGTPNLFTMAAQEMGPFLAATEMMLGHAVALSADVGRSNYTILMGGNQVASQWGPMAGGTTHLAALRHAKSRWKAKLVVVDPRRTELAREATEHVAIRPGTDTFFLLGLLHLVASGRYWDSQFVTDYCKGLPQLQEWVQPWTPERVADICGIDLGQLSGIALKFAKAPMACIVRGRGQLMGPHATVGCWALLALHGLTANLLRPGGLFDSPGLVDFHPFFSAVPSHKAPKSRVSGISNILLQLPGSLLDEELARPGEGQVHALITVRGDPLTGLPNSQSLNQSIGRLDLHVVVDDQWTATAQKAHFVLPARRFWEVDEVLAHHTGWLPRRFSQWTDALVEGADLPTVEEVLRKLFKRTRIPFFGGVWGAHLSGLGRMAMGADLPSWEKRLFDNLGDVALSVVKTKKHGLDAGEIDRAKWRITSEDGRIDLAPPALEAAISYLEPPEPGHQDSLWLGSRSATVGKAMPTREEPLDHTLVEIGPETANKLGLTHGGEALLEGEGGVLEVIVAVDPELRAEVAILPWGWGPAVDLGGIPTSPGRLLAKGPRDPITGATPWSGNRVSLRKR